jgi:hypothetical protein
MPQDTQNIGFSASRWADSGGPTIRPECRYPDPRAAGSGWLAGIWSRLRSLISF